MRLAIYIDLHHHREAIMAKWGTTTQTTTEVICDHAAIGGLWAFCPSCGAKSGSPPYVRTTTTIVGADGEIWHDWISPAWEAAFDCEAPSNYGIDTGKVVHPLREHPAAVVGVSERMWHDGDTARIGNPGETIARIIKTCTALGADVSMDDVEVAVVSW
jgi:hypothetical protein